MEIEFITRAMVDGDRHFIFNSYLKSLRKGYPLNLVPHFLYFGPQGRILDFLLRSAEVTVACFPEEPTEILGYAIHQRVPEAVAVHYLYSRRSRSGIARGLYTGIVGAAKLVIATHVTNDFMKLRGKSHCRVVYDPYLVGKLMALR